MEDGYVNENQGAPPNFSEDQMLQEGQVPTYF